MIRSLVVLATLACLGAWQLPAAENKSNKTKVDPQAQRILRNACQYLADTPFFSITAEVWHESVTENGDKVQFTRAVEMEVKRPARLHVEISSPHTQRGFWYDGKSLSICDRTHNVFSMAAVPSTIDAALDAAHDEFGVDLPLIDLAVSDPYQNAMARVQSARYFGMAAAMGFNCHHLAFTQDNVDWQVWIQDGPQPLIRKFVIIHKNEPGAPEFTGLIRSWNLTERIADSDFVFEPPRGTSKVQMLKDGQQTNSGSGNKGTAAVTNSRGGNP